MRTLPPELQPFAEDAKRILLTEGVTDIEFSGSTYQIKVQDQAQEAWAFIHLDPQGLLQDSFCSCAEGEEGGPCPHVAAGYLHIYQNRRSPLHIRFQRSFWKALFRMFAHTYGTENTLIQTLKKGGWLLAETITLSPNTSIGEERLKELLSERPQETEETSLKFSNVSEEEILLWRRGTPSEELLYRLSFWNDLAKWFFLLQEANEPYLLTFEEDVKRLPNRLQAQFSDAFFSAPLTQENLIPIIPTLKTVKTPYTVHDSLQDTLQQLEYNENKGELCLTPNPVKHLPNALPLGPWLFIPGEGFYPTRTSELLSQKSLSGETLGLFLSSYAEELGQLLEPLTIDASLHHLKYALSFDSFWNLVIQTYLKEPNDLSCPHAQTLGDWVYIPKKGFFQTTGRAFLDDFLTIKETDIPSWIQEKRAWLSQQPGFKVHLAGVEAEISYSIDRERCLRFERSVEAKGTKRTHEFGPWIYIEKQGFFTKVTPQMGLPIAPDVKINVAQIPNFIRINRPELQLVPHFFLEECPLKRVGLRVTLLEDQRLLIIPQHELVPAFESATIDFFEDFIYVEGKGFYECPLHFRLPEDYQTPLMLEGAKLTRFLQQELANLGDKILYLDPRLTPPKRIDLVLTEVSREKTHYSLHLHYSTDRGIIPLEVVWEAVHQKKGFLFLDQGCLNLSLDRFSWIKKIPRERLQKGYLTLTTLELIRLYTLEFLEGEGLLKELVEMLPPDEPHLEGLLSTLRAYQKKGVDWLWFLYHYRLSGLLCDDMGLGKTHQAMALFAAVRHALKPRKTHFLVICPTSVLYHWKEKLEEFFPDLKVCWYHGTGRELKSLDGREDVLLTSYGIWRRECQMLGQMRFDVAVFDEVQVAKNQQSRLFASLLHVRANMRLGLTGTPIENQLKDLKTLFDLVLPTYMPGEAEFTRIFVKSVDRAEEKKRRERLSRFIRPFVLRRKKEDVLQDLPEKIEEIAHCDLHLTQRQLYQEVLQRGRERVFADWEDTSPVPYLHIFTLLTHLKQVCDHPALYLKETDDYEKYHSGKWNLFLELLNEAKESGQKVVVFSQYLGMLDIIEKHLTMNQIGFASIRGSTIDRQSQLKKFAKDPHCKVFVASLKAVGLGVDLTAASVVIHYDRWWNRAREDQATDRVHRMGQTRGVQVFKLETKGTFEERIGQLIRQKGELMEDVVGVDDFNVIKRLNRDELFSLLELV